MPLGFSRARALAAARAAFLVAAVAFGWWGLRPHWDAIGRALGAASPARVALAFLLTLAGLAITGSVWRRILAGYGHDVPPRSGDGIFFLGQLGKYIPGSVWSLGAQAEMARRLQVPPRTTVSVGLVFLWVHLATAAIVAGLLVGPVTAGGPVVGVAARALAVAAGAVALTPAVLGRLGTRLARAAEPLHLDPRGVATVVALMAVVWLLYGAACVAVLPPAAVLDAGGAGRLLGPVAGAFAASYVVGVLVVVAPAGAGAREVALVALLAPTLGVPVAAAGALLVRVVHTAADVAIAGIAWLAARGPGPRPGR